MMIARRRVVDICGVSPWFSQCRLNSVLSGDFKAKSKVNSKFVDYKLTVQEFKNRRRNFVDKLVQISDESRLKLERSVFDKSGENKKAEKNENCKHLVVIPSSHKQYMVDKIPYFYRPATDMRYLTGHTETNSALVMEVETDSSGQADFRSILFVQDPDVREEKWEGSRLRPDEAKEKFDVDEVRLMSQFGKHLQNYSDVSKVSHSTWYDYLNPTHKDIHRTMTESVFGNVNDNGFSSPRQALHETRVIKSPAEIKLMKKTCEIASESIKETIRQTLTWSSEAQAFATVDYHCKMRGASYLAYPPVVAAGDNATVIHYTANSNQSVDRGEMMLMDAGCEFGGYTSDVTRTWPLSGKFDITAQRMVFEAVYDVQATLIRLLKAGNLNGRPLTIDSLYHESQRLFKPHFVDLGLVSEDCDPVMANVVCSELCPHHVSHYLGMDVHDTALVSRNIPLRPGMVITLEPGLYFPRSRTIRHVDPKALSKLLGIGVRIEDDILITENADEKAFTSCQVLTESCPKSLEEIEDLIQQ